MSDAKRRDLIGWDENASRSPARNRTFMLPDVLSERLDKLVRLLDDSGFRSTRAELVAALLLNVEPDAAKLDELVRSYKQATVADAHLGKRNGAGLQLEPAHPGPRARS